MEVLLFCFDCLLINTQTRKFVTRILIDLTYNSIKLSLRWVISSTYVLVFIHLSFNGNDFLHSMCVLYTSPIIVKVCSICHLANIKLCCTRIFHVVVFCCFFFLIIKKDCSFCVFMFNCICILFI
jgi:hypothetical protein